MEQLTLSTSDNSKMRVHISYPEQKAKAGIIILQEAFGVNNHILELTKRFADEGYLTIAPELYHRTAPPGSTWDYDQFQSLNEHLSAITESGIYEDIQVCFDWLKKNGAQSVASIGYCLGGRVSFIANAKIPLSCAISYYGGRISPSYLHLVDLQKAPLLFFWGGLDKHIPDEQIQIINKALTESNKKFTSVLFSYADHGFFCDQRPSYNANAAKQSWAITLEFLKEHCPMV